MKGYTPKFECKNQIELSNKEPIIELGIKQKQCNCKDGVCEYDINKST